MSHPILRADTNRIALRTAMRDWLRRWRSKPPRPASQTPQPLVVSDIIDAAHPIAGIGSDFVPTQDLTPHVARDWLDAACIDAAIDEDDEIIALVDGVRVQLSLRPNDGFIHAYCFIGCDPDLDCDPEHMLWAVNEMNRSARFLRATLEARETDPQHAVRYDYEHFAIDGVITQRQLAKLVRNIRSIAIVLHERLHGMM